MTEWKKTAETIQNKKEFRLVLIKRVCNPDSFTGC